MSREALDELARSTGIPVDIVTELWLERASIREFEGGQSRADAEAGALDDIRALLDATGLANGPRKGPKASPNRDPDASPLEADTVVGKRKIE